jgi:hypothetical protein
MECLAKSFPQARALFILALRDPHFQVRSNARDLVAQSRDQGLVDALYSLVLHPVLEGESAFAAYDVVNLGIVKLAWIPELIQIAEQPTDGRRKAALWLLGTLGSEDVAFNQLVQWRAANDDDLEHAIIRACGFRRDDRSMSILKTVTERKAHWACDALAMRNDPPAREELRKRLSGRGAFGRYCAADALVSLGEDSAQAAKEAARAQLDREEQ